MARRRNRREPIRHVPEHLTRREPRRVIGYETVTTTPVRRPTFVPNLGYVSPSYADIHSRFSPRPVQRKSLTGLDAQIVPFDLVPYSGPRINNASPYATRAVVKPKASNKKVSGLDYKQIKQEPVKQSPEKVRDNKTCKSRPEQNTKKSGGSGVRREFIPWCDRRS